MKHASFVVAVVLLGSGCGPNPPAPVQVMAVAPTQTGAYSTRQVTLRTITSMTALKGSIAEFTGGARIVFDGNDPLQQINGGLVGQSEDQRFQSTVKDKGLDVRGNYIERAGVLWPADFDTWNMVTTYYNFEQSYAYWQAVNTGVDLPELQKMRVYYWPDVHFDSSSATTDNALFLSVIKSFIIVPQGTEQTIPLAMNLGVIGHETAHKVFNHRVMNDEGIHPALVNWSLAPFNLLKSIDEGFADFHGYGVTCASDTGCRPQFLNVSIADTRSTSIRDLSNPNACLTESLKSSFTNSNSATWIRSPDLYQVGNIFAAALYQAGNQYAGLAGVTQMEHALLASYNDPTPGALGLSQLLNQNIATPAAFTPEAVANSIAAHISDATLRKLWCNEISDRMDMTTCLPFPCPTVLPACPTTSSRGTVAACNK